MIVQKGPIDFFDGTEFDFLSNFHPTKGIMYNDITYPTTEHAFQAMKSIHLETRYVISRLPTPGAAKSAGRRLNLRVDWDEIKDQVMRDVLELKFSDPALRNKLLATGNRDLIEGNTWHDNYWGDCQCNVGACKKTGKNKLGILLMELRAQLVEAKK